MKKLLIISGAVIILILTITCCQKENRSIYKKDDPRLKYSFFNKLKDPKPADYLDKKGLSTKVKVKFRWDGCEKPLGICLIIPLSVNNLQAFDSDTSDYGLAQIEITDGQVHLMPEKIIYFSEGGYFNKTVPIDHDVIIPSDIASLFGYKSVIILKGLYKIHFNNHKKYGEIFLNAKTIK